MFNRIAILGTGLIGGSFALAVRRYLGDVPIVGWDKPDVLRQAQERGAIGEAARDFASALRGADLIYLALPVGLTLEILPAIARHAEPEALVTDACSTKSAICRAAATQFGGSVRFLGGHPMAGREISGIESADSELFRWTKYVLIARSDDPDPLAQNFAVLLRRLSAEPVWMDADTHDWAVAIISHLPQLVAVALAGVVSNETDETGLPLSLAGGGSRDMLRLSGSAYDVWRDICLTNTDNIAHALDRLSQALDHLRTRLASRELEGEFAVANEVYKILRGLQ